MVKTVEISGAEVKVEKLGGQNVAVKNLGSAPIYASIQPNITAGADNVVEIPAGAGEVVLDANGTLYLLGNGKVQCTGTNYASPNFKLPSSSSGEGGKTVEKASAYSIDNAVDYPIVDLRLYGKSTQDGTPTPEAPVEIVSVGDSGAVKITSNNGGDISLTANLTSALPLCGIPVDADGNYTDSAGQQWICDELIYNADGTGKVVKRINTETADGNKINFIGSSGINGYFAMFNPKYEALYNHDIRGVISNKFKGYSYNNRVLDVEADKVVTQENFITFKTADNTSKDWSSLKLAKQWFNEYAPIISYVLAAPQEIPLTAEEMSQLQSLQTFDGITNISNDSGAEMRVKYCTNRALSEYVKPIKTGLQKQIDELKTAVLSLGGNV